MTNSTVWRTSLRLLFALSGAVLLSSCSTLTAKAPSVTVAAATTPQAITPKVDSPRVSSSVTPESGSSGPVVRQNGSDPPFVTPMPGTDSRYSVTDSGGISLNYVDTDVREIARLILGNILKANYSIDPGFQGTVTIQTARPLKRSELIPTLQALLSQAGGQITYQQGLYRISARGSEGETPGLVSEGGMAGSQVITLRYASARQLATMLESYAGDGAKIIADPGRNVLIVSGSATARQNIIDLVRVFDVDYLAGESYALFPAKTGDPVKLATDLQAALQLDFAGPLSNVVKIVPIDQANAVMVITRQPAYLDRISHLIDQLDQVKLSAGRNIHVYYLKNTQPSDLQPLIQRAINPPNGGGGGEEQSAPGNLPPTATPARIGSSASGTGSGAGTNPSSGTGMTADNSAPAAGPGPMPANSNDNANQQEEAGGNAKGPQIIADNGNSALIVVATESEYASIEAAIRKLDVLPMQVLIEATIAEVTLNNNLQYGVQFFLNNNEGQITLSNAQSPSTAISPGATPSTASLFPGVLASNFPGFAVARTAGDVQVALQALKNITNVQIISAPKLLILDKQQASFQVGDLVPTITQSATSVITAGAPVVNNVQYQATGVILTVTPRINSGGLVTLDIEQEVSDVVPTTTSSINSPTFQQRKIKTKVIVQDGETISLAGLISDKKTKGTSGVPFLQDIPGLGALFSTKTNENDRTELLVLLTPHVVNNQQDARALTEELKRKLSPSTILP
jgi:general secretion pathway protein D